MHSPKSCWPIESYGLSLCQRCLFALTFQFSFPIYFVCFLAFIRSVSPICFIFRRPVPPQIMPFSFGEGSLTSGQPVAIQCTVLEGDFPLSLRWAFHGQELSSQMGISIIKAGNRVSILTIDSIAAGHSGDYTCTATNSAASVNYTASLAVNGLFQPLY